MNKDSELLKRATLIALEKLNGSGNAADVLNVIKKNNLHVFGCKEENEKTILTRNLRKNPQIVEENGLFQFFSKETIKSNTFEKNSIELMDKIPKKFREQFPDYESTCNYTLNEKVLRAVSYKIPNLIYEKVKTHCGSEGLNADSCMSTVANIVSIATNNEKTKHWGWDFIQRVLEEQMLDFKDLKLHKFMDAVNQIINFLGSETSAVSELNELFEEFEFPYRLTGDINNPWESVIKLKKLTSLPLPVKPISICVLCDVEVDNITTETEYYRDIKSFDCYFCGCYKITCEAYEALDTVFKHDRAKISAFTQERTLQKLPELVIVLDEESATMGIGKNFISIRRILEQFPETISERGTRTLANLAAISDFKGFEIEIHFGAYQIFFAETNEEEALGQQISFIVSYLEKKGYIEASNQFPPLRLTVTPFGWEFLENEKGSSSEEKVVKDKEIKRDEAKKMKNDTKPAVFIGSSINQLDVAYALQTNLEVCSEPTVWNQGIFQLSKTTIGNLMNALNNFDFAVFIFAPDDIAQIKNETVNTVRDNVIFELGLFIGKLGIERAYFIVPNGVEKLHLPSDLLAVTYGSYNGQRQDGNLRAALGPVSNEIGNLIRELGAIQQ